MENASKALLIAAGTLIGIIILSMIAVFSNIFGNYAREYIGQMQDEKILAFNAQFSQYENREVTAQDVLSIINLVEEWNDNSEEKITITGNINQNNFKNYTQLKKDVMENDNGYAKYEMSINEYNHEGRVSKINITKK